MTELVVSNDRLLKKLGEINGTLWALVLVLCFLVGVLVTK